MPAFTLDGLAQLLLMQFVQLTLLIALVGMVNRLLQDRAPRLALALWLLVLLKALTPPLVASNLGVFSWIEAARELPATSVAVLPYSGAFTVLSGYGAALLAVWAAGAFVMAATLLVRKRSLDRRIQRDAVDATHPLLLRAVRLAEQHGLRRPKRVAVSRDEYGPAVAGVFTPTLVLPKSLVELGDDAALRPIILHELVHAERRDTAVAAAQCLATTVWWFHPLVWWSTREADRLTERCVDLTIVDDLGSGLLEYARGLVRVLELRETLQTRADLASLKPCEITMDRLRFLRDAKSRLLPRCTRITRWGRRLALVALAALTLPSLPTDALQPTCTVVLSCGADAEVPIARVVADR